MIHWKRLWCWEGLGTRREGDDRGWDGWMASLTRWMWVRVNSGSWWWTGRPGVLRFMGSQRVGHDWATGLNWTELNWIGTMEKEMATHSSVLAWRIPWMEKPGRLQSMGLHRVGHDWSNLVVVVVIGTKSGTEMFSVLDEEKVKIYDRF